MRVTQKNTRLSQKVPPYEYLVFNLQAPSFDPPMVGISIYQELPSEAKFRIGK